MLRTSIGRLRLVGILEGISFLVLLGIAMPLKYVLHDPRAVRIVGMGHGLLFVLFVTLLMTTASERSWPAKRVAVAFLASIVPFGPFVLDRKLAAEEDAAS